MCLFDHWLCFTWLYSCRSWSLSFLMHKEWIVEARLVYFLMFQLGCHCETNMVEDMRWFMRFPLLQVISEIIETCRAHEFTDVVLVHEHRGVPDGLIICHLPFGPTAYFGLLNVVSSLISVVLYWHLLCLFFFAQIFKYFLACRLPDMILRTEKPLVQCLRLTHIWFSTTSNPRYSYLSGEINYLLYNKLSFYTSCLFK